MSIHSVDALYDGDVGLASPPRLHFPDNGDIPIAVETFGIDNAIVAWPAHTRTLSKESMEAIHGTGSSVSTTEARIPALGELLERYCATIYSEQNFVVSSARSLTGNCLSLAAVPQCSMRELLDPLCPVSPPDQDIPIRWVRSVCLTEDRDCFVPACMVYPALTHCNSGERFAFPISTGCAAHVSMEQAVIAGLCEVLERDAISLTWLQMLSLPELISDSVPNDLSPEWQAHLFSSKDIHCRFFDATTDIGIPTVYGIQHVERDRRACYIASCATDLDFPAALSKVRRDMAVSSIGFRHPRSFPDHREDCSGLWDGAIYMARSDMSHAYNFLLGHSVGVNFVDLNAKAETDDLSTLLRRLSGLGHPVYAVDLTTDEALHAGMRVVKVLVPTLQPLSFSYRARFLGHPRLYTAPKRMGYKVLSEDEINPWPQPFA